MLLPRLPSSCARGFARRRRGLRAAAAGALPLAFERPGMAGDGAHLPAGERTRATGREPAEPLRSHPRADEPHHRMPERGERPPDLALASLAHDEPEARRVPARVEARDADAG